MIKFFHFNKCCSHSSISIGRYRQSLNGFSGLITGAQIVWNNGWPYKKSIKNIRFYLKGF